MSDNPIVQPMPNWEIAVGVPVYVDEKYGGFKHWADASGMVSGRVVGFTANGGRVYVEIEHPDYGTKRVMRLARALYRRELGAGK